MIAHRQRMTQLEGGSGRETRDWLWFAHFSEGRRSKNRKHSPLASADDAGEKTRQPDNQMHRTNGLTEPDDERAELKKKSNTSGSVARHVLVRDRVVMGEKLPERRKSAIEKRNTSCERRRE